MTRPSCRRFRPLQLGNKYPWATWSHLSFRLKRSRYALPEVNPARHIIIMIAMSSIIWHNLQQAEKLSLVMRLNTMRLSLLEKARIRRAAHSSKKRSRKKELTFKSAELREFFQTMPDDMKKFIGG